MPLGLVLPQKCAKSAIYHDLSVGATKLCHTYTKVKKKTNTLLQAKENPFYQEWPESPANSGFINQQYYSVTTFVWLATPACIF